MHNQVEKEPIDFRDRVVSGFLCTLLAAATMAVYLLFLFLRLGRGSEGIYRTVFSDYGLLSLPAVFLLGFLAGPRKLAIGLSFFWGTHPKWKQEPWRTRTILLLFLLLTVYLAVELLHR